MIVMASDVCCQLVTQINTQERLVRVDQAIKLTLATNIARKASVAARHLLSFAQRLANEKTKFSHR